MKKLSVIAFLLTLLCSCSVKTPIIPNLEIIDIPPCNQISTAEIGDTVVSKGKIYTYDGLVLSIRSQVGDGFFLKKFTAEPGRYLAKEQDTNSTYYFAEAGKFKVFDALLGESYQPGGIRIHKSKTMKDQLFMGGNYASLTPTQSPIYTKKKIKAVDQPSFQQELIYNGRIGNNVKFLYRELSNDVMRPAFTQEIQYDLSQETVFGFKGVRFEILQATNTYLKYKILKSFPDRL